MHRGLNGAEMAYNDRELTCRDCGGAFEFTAGEQEFYASKGLQNDPVRCPSCRAQRRMMRPEDRDDTPNYGVYVSWGGRTPRQPHVAICSSCNTAAEVPFVPRGDRPIFCSDCYNEERKRLEELELAEADAAAARISVAAGRVPPPEDREAGGAAEVAVAEPEVAAEPEPEEEPRPVVADSEAAPQ